MILALDTSQSFGSIALKEEQSLVYSAYFDIRITHSETLMPAIDEAFKLCGYQPKDLSAIVLSIGPGSFTGLRIGLATAKGMAFALNIPVFTFDSLILGASPLIGFDKEIFVALDARMKELYIARYSPSLTELMPPKAVIPQDLLDYDLKDCIITGSGVQHIKPIMDEAGIALNYADETMFFPKAEHLLWLLENKATKEHRGEELMDLAPLYIRESTAQIKARNKK
ncbi:MAG: tRNA (adenosine(37)-N6)-threonylcarbamoyltransferase complex dimerization subunit type 1 TsaB [Candidatus Cloacimonetes bacterium]|nr:tRNA (adenosine(37)-N6)-threonylcarbamoyltransferase complex dimerization subunit type 1 TsaB [Candidatus Cloacimonadota bacterium]